MHACLAYLEAHCIERLHELGIDPNTYSDISSQHLDDVLKNVKADYPKTGEVLLKGHLLHMGIKVPRAKLRSSIHRVDHTNTRLRQSHVISRRVYSVPRPNEVWHIDGNHKMIHWRLVIHAGIDGFTRCIVFIKCSNNNCASTVLEAFNEGESVYGNPASVRSDNGGENVKVWQHVRERHGKVMTGKSCHNERIERLWRDVTRCVSSSFIEVFTALEADGLLDACNEVDLFCLHFVFLPRINKSLTDFQGSWNHHSLSTEGNVSPLQLMIEGLCVSGQDLPSQSCEIDPDRLDSTPPPHATLVEVPTNNYIPCDRLLTNLTTTLQPTAPCTDFGREFYCMCIQLVGQHLQNSCNSCKINT